MARINIEDSLAHDERMKAAIRKLGEAMAFGEWYRIARCAQRYWLDGKKLIPESVWEISEFQDVFISVGLVKRLENGLYLSGSENYFAWLVSKKENGRLGGKKSGKSRKINNIIEAKRSESEANASETKPLTLTLTLPPTPTQIHNTLGVDESPPPFGFKQIVKIWNNAAEQLGLPKTKETSKLLDAIVKNNKKALLTYPDEESWQRIAEAIPLQNWRLGANDRGWKADFAWLFQNHGTKKVKNYILLMEEWENYYGDNKND